MVYDKWDWTFTTGSGLPDSWEPIYNSPILTQNTESGYSPSSPSWTRDRWLFKFSWDCLLPECMVYIVNFFHNHRGGSPFYMGWPMGLYGLPPLLETATPTPIDPFESEIESGYGESPIYLVGFTIDVLSLKKLKGYDAWLTTQPLEVMQL